MTIMPKVYLFYYRDKKFNDIPYRLYAWSTDKNHVDIFKTQRDMKRFVVIKEHMDDEAFDKFRADYDKYRLNESKMYTRGIINSLKSQVTVLCTVKESEEIFVSIDRFWNEIASSFVDCRNLKSKYIKALKDLIYIDIYNFYKVKIDGYMDDFYEPYYTAYGPVESFLIDEFNHIYGLDYDELAMFIWRFGNTFNKNFVEKKSGP